MERPPALKRDAWALIIVAGILGSVVHIMIEMVYEGTYGLGVWAPLNAIGAVLLRDLIPDPTLMTNVWTVTVGTIVHLAVGIVFALLFGVAGPAVTRSHGLIGLGVVWGVLVYGFAHYVYAPLLNPAMLALDQLVLLIAHVGYGLTLGAMTFWVAGTGRPRYMRRVG